MAQQLDGLGQRVAVLALMDSSPVGVIPWATFLQAKVPHYCRRIGIHGRRWWKMPIQDRRNYMQGRWGAFRRVLAKNRPKPMVFTVRTKQDKQPPQVDGFIDYYHAVASSYQMDKYSGSADVFVSDSAESYAMSVWKYFAIGKLNSHRIPGGHHEIMSPEHLPALTESLRDVLQQAHSVENDKNLTELK